ncbi:MAG: hypothetical protein RSA98_05250 [Odoribacter sp.]
MKIIQTLAIASLLVALIGCKKNDDNSLPLDGEWIVIQRGEKTFPSTEIAVMSFDARTLTTSYADRDTTTGGGFCWLVVSEKYLQSGNQLVCTKSKIKIKMLIKSITADRLEYIITESSVPLTEVIGKVNVAEKAIDTYSSKLIGTWELVRDSKPSESYRIKYAPDGTYDYLIKNEAGEWIKSIRPISKYRLYGSYLVTEYVPTSDNTPYCDIWRVISIEDNVMTSKMSESGKEERTWVMKKIL